ncbi:uncharacterized protein LOC135213381 [Macrobrachium nipponense]|uniref:uncharacterized protein LOC135213381 n=1 Tax=Macrobrachium nipponense TaxID=159736 RepID=UPI0030C8157C
MSLLERLVNDEIRRKAGLEKRSEVIRESRLRWHGDWGCFEEGVKKRAWEESVGGRSRGRQRMRWRDRVKEDMERRGLVEDDDAYDGGQWKRRRRRIKQPTP